MMSIKEWQRHCHNIAKLHGWWDENVQHDPITKAVLLHSEVSEFVEEIRVGNTPGGFTVIEGKPVGPAIELADLAIRLLDCAEAWGVDLEYMIKMKSRYNESRPFRVGANDLVGAAHKRD